MRGIELLELSKYLICIFFPLVILGQNYPDKTVDNLLKDGIQKILFHDYETADKIFSDLDSKYPGLPFGKVYLAASRIAESVDLAFNFDDEYIYTQLSKAEMISDSLLNIDDDNIWYNYFKAISLGYLAYFEAMQEDYFMAFSNGIISLKYFEKCAEIDTSFYESFIASGTYLYWKSVKMKDLLWLPFVQDTREEGLALLLDAVKYSSYNKYVAVNSLIWIYIDRREYKEAAGLAESVLVEYPECRIFKWGLARAYEDIDPKIAINVYLEILNSVLESEPNNHFNEIVLLHKIAMLRERSGELNEAFSLCEEILKYDNLESDVKKQLHERIERVKTLKEELRIKIARQ